MGMTAETNARKSAAVLKFFMVCPVSLTNCDAITALLHVNNEAMHS